MIVRCPKCEYSRTISEHKIPPTAEVATCPRCKYRFRFRTLDPIERLETETTQPAPPPRRDKDEPAEHGKPAVDIWEAMDVLHQRWEAQLEKTVSVVEERIQKPQHAPSPAASSEETAVRETSPVNPRPQQPAAPVYAEDRSPEEAEQAPPQTLRLRQPHAASESAPPEPEVREAQQQRVAPAVQAHKIAPQPVFYDEPGTAGQTEQPAEAPEEAPPFPEREESPPVFPYSQDNEVAPEERVERDLMMLKGSGSSRPSRDLGRLDDGLSPKKAPADFVEDAQVADATNVPWESPEKYGWVKAFTRTVSDVLFTGPRFFATLGSAEGMIPSYLFFLILGYTAIIFSLIWERAAALLLNQATFTGSSPYILPVLLLLAPFALGLVQIFLVGSLRLVTQMTAPEKAQFSRIFRIVGYAAAPLVVSVIPFVGPVIGIAWFLVCLMIGCRNALKFPWSTAILAPIPPALLMVGVIVLYFR